MHGQIDPATDNKRTKKLKDVLMPNLKSKNIIETTPTTYLYRPLKRQITKRRINHIFRPTLESKTYKKKRSQRHAQVDPMKSTKYKGQEAKDMHTSSLKSNTILKGENQKHAQTGSEMDKSKHIRSQRCADRS